MFLTPSYWIYCWTVCVCTCVHVHVNVSVRVCVRKWEWMDIASLAGDVHSIDTYSEITKMWFLALIMIQNKFDFEKNPDFITTRMHSGRMRTNRSCSPFPTPGTRHPSPPPGPDTPHPRDQTPLLWTEWQTGAKILPCPKLRLRVVININTFMRVHHQEIIDLY